MPRRYLYVMDPIASIDPTKDTTFDFMLESQARGVSNWICGVEDLVTRGGRGFALAREARVERPGEPGGPHHETGPLQEFPFDDFQVIWMRKDPPVDDGFLQATMLLDRYSPASTLMMNEPASLRIANEKLFGLFAPELFPYTAISSRVDILVAEVEKLGKAVIKPLNLAGGAGVMVFDRGDRNLRAALDLLTLEGRRPAIVQEFLPAVREGDKRVILLGGDPIGAVVRVPSAGDHRANMHVGGVAARGIINERDREIAARLKPALLKFGLYFVGLDVIGDKLTEINVTSPTGVQEIDALDERQGSERMSAKVMDYVEQLLTERGI